MPYIKYSALTDSTVSAFDEIDSEPDIRVRLMSLSSTLTGLSARAERSLELATFQAKASGIPADVIAAELGVSKRMVLRLIRSHAERTGLASPLDRIDAQPGFDVRSIVR